MANMPPALAQAGRIHHTNSAKTSRETANAVQKILQNMQGSNFGEKTEWYRAVAIPLITKAIQNGQAQSLIQTVNYLKVAGAIQGIDTLPLLQLSAFLTPEEVMAPLLNSQINTYVVDTIAGKPENLSKLSLGFSLMNITQMAVSDPGREASSAVILGTEEFGGYYRVLDTPACKRCAVLAGKWFKDNDGFERHPRCQCTHLPAGEAYDDATTDPREAIQKGQVTGLSKADTEAILEHNADVSQVINASSGLSTETLFGQKVRTTTVGKSSRAVAGKRLGDLQKQAGSRYRQSQNTRLSVGQILKLAGGDQGRAKEMLLTHGYLL